MMSRISRRVPTNKKTTPRPQAPSKCFKKQKTACVIGSKKKEPEAGKQIMNISEYLDQKRKASPQLQKAPQARSKFRSKKPQTKGVPVPNISQRPKPASKKMSSRRSLERTKNPRRRIEIIKSPPIKKKYTNWLRQEEISGKWVRQAESPANLVTSGLRMGPRRVYLRSPPPSKLGESSRSQTPLEATIRMYSNIALQKSKVLKKARSQVTQPKKSVHPAPAKKRQSRVTLSRLKKSLLLQKKDDHPLYGSGFDTGLEQSSHNLEQYRSCQNHRQTKLGHEAGSMRPARRVNGPRGQSTNVSRRLHKPLLMHEPEMTMSQHVGSPPNLVSGSSRIVKPLLKKSKTQNYGRDPCTRSQRKVIKYSLKDFNSSEHQLKKRRNQMKSVEIISRAKKPNKPVRQAPFQKWPSWKNKANKLTPQIETESANKRPDPALEKPHDFNPFISNSPQVSNVSLMSTLPTPLAPTHSLHSKMGRISTHSNYSLHFPQKSSFVMKNNSSTNPNTRNPFSTSSFHTNHFGQSPPNFGQSLQEKQLRKAQSYFHSEDPPSDIFKMDPQLVRTVSDPFTADESCLSKLSSQNHLLFSTDANLSSVSSPNRQSNCTLAASTSILNDTRNFNLISPNNLIMMPLGSISNETRVNIYNQAPPDMRPQDAHGKVKTGRPHLGVVHEKMPPKKCFTSSRQGLCGNSLTELLTGLRPNEPSQEDASKRKKTSDQVYRKAHTSKLQRGPNSRPNRPVRAKVAKSQPKRQRFNTSQSSVYRNQAKFGRNNFFKVEAKETGNKEKKLWNSFKKQSKENKAGGMNHKSHFKKKRSRRS